MRLTQLEKSSLVKLQKVDLALILEPIWWLIQKGMMVNKIEKKDTLAGYLKSYEFFSTINKEKCSLTSFDLSKRNFIVRNNDYYVDIILRFNDKKRIS